MSDSNTSPQSAPHHFIADPDPTDRYDKLFFCVRTDDRLDLKAKWVYTIIAGAARRSRELNVSDEELCAMTGLSERSNRDALNMLARTKLIHVQTFSLGQGNGKRRVIQIPRLGDVYTPANSAGVKIGTANSAFTPANSAFGTANSAGVYKVTTDVTTDGSNTYPPTPQGEEEVEEGFAPSLDQNQGPPAQTGTGRNRNQTENSGLSKSNNTSPMESENPYWNEMRLKTFTHLYNFYPKPGNKTEAAVAWRETVGDRADGIDGIAPPYLNAFCKGLDSWMNKWKQEWDQEGDRWIPFFANFIRKEKWKEAPRMRR